MNPCHCAQHRSSVIRGFTLLEVLIAMALFSTLLALLFSLFSTYTRLAERSRRTATEIQLVRSLSRQLRGDVDHFASLPMTPNVVLASDAEFAEPASVITPPDVGQGAVATDPSAFPGQAADDVAVLTESTTGNPAASPAAIASRLPEETYLRGSATKLELVTRLPYTVQTPQAFQMIGDETRYGTYQLVIYEYRDAKDLRALLDADPILNPPTFDTPVSNVSQARESPAELRRSDPNDSVGLIRETKSWLQVTRDQRRETMKQQAEAARRFGEAPSAAVEARDLAGELRRKLSGSPNPSQPVEDPQAAPPWRPPQEMRAHRDHLPEVTRLQFRYFDGEQWRLDWQGAAARLPAAIEVAFDVDPDAPAARAKEFDQAHARMVAGAALEEVLPPPIEPEPATFEDLQDPLTALQLEDPTAIVTEYRFVIALTRSRGTTAERSSDTLAGDEP